jgi:hypothetical protein
MHIFAYNGYTVKWEGCGENIPAPVQTMLAQARYVVRTALPGL